MIAILSLQNMTKISCFVYIDRMPMLIVFFHLVTKEFVPILDATGPFVVRASTLAVALPRRSGVDSLLK